MCIRDRHSEALEFKPIHRLLTNVDVKDMLSFFEAEITKQGLESTEGCLLYTSRCV